MAPAAAVCSGWVGYFPHPHPHPHPVETQGSRSSQVAHSLSRSHDGSSPAKRKYTSVSLCSVDQGCTPEHLKIEDIQQRLDKISSKVFIQNVKISKYMAFTLGMGENISDLKVCNQRFRTLLQWAKKVTVGHMAMSVQYCVTTKITAIILFFQSRPKYGCLKFNLISAKLNLQIKI